MTIDRVIVWNIIDRKENDKMKRKGLMTIDSNEGLFDEHERPFFYTYIKYKGLQFLGH